MQSREVLGEAIRTLIMMKKILLLLTATILAACNDSTTAESQMTGNTPESEPAMEMMAASEMVEDPVTAEQAEDRLSLEQIQQKLDIPVLSQPWTGDLDGMVKRRVVRVLTVYGLGRYYVDKAREKGITYELFKMFEDSLNERLGNKNVRIHVIFIPVARDELIPGLLEGRGDIAAASLTITPEREELIDFSDPLTRELSEILVTGPNAPPISSIDDLAGRKVYVRASSSYRSSLDALNRKFREEGKQEIKIQYISEFLEDEDILELVNSGALEWAVVDDYKAQIWTGVFENLTVRDDIVFRSGGRLGHAIRKDSPQLMAVLNDFVKTHRQGTLKGNILINRYIDKFDWTQNALGAEDYQRFREVITIFEKYGEQYGVDYLIVAAQGYQESQLKQTARSKAGAVGIMQLLPSTAADPNVGISDISTAEDNIHAGVRYLNFIRNRYFNDPEMDDFNKTLFALAAYNAGPARVAKLRNKAAQQGYNPDKWFDNVEIIAAKEIGRETVQYVANILKYYVVYRLSIIRILQRQEQKELQRVE
jgi:membrane-bound lytic murein transglycosylase MltF